MSDSWTDALVAEIVENLRLYGPADAHVLSGRILGTDFSHLMFCIGVAAGQRKIIQERVDQAWTGEWADVWWKAAP